MKEEVKRVFKQEYTYEGAFSEDIDFAIDFVCNRFIIQRKLNEEAELNIRSN